MKAFQRTLAYSRLSQRRPLAHKVLVFAPRRCASTQFGQTSIDPNVDPGPNQPEDEKGGRRNQRDKPRISPSVWKVFETAATTFASIAILGLAGYSYHLYYKSMVLRKIERAFMPGDPMLDLATSPPLNTAKLLGEDAETSDLENDTWILRAEQSKVDDIILGARTGRYYLIVGEKGTGKSTMILDAMRKTQGEGVSMFEAHADLEIFRLRLGKALNYDFHEDYIGSLFSIRGPRDTTALLDIERAFNKVEKIALKRRDEAAKAPSRTRAGPLVIVVNCMHLIRDDEDGQDLIELMQQRAEQWAASNLITVVFNSDDYWVYERLKRYATRMEVLPILDLPKPRAITALSRFRARYFPEEEIDSDIIRQVYDQVGGRTNFLSRVAKSRDMLGMCKTIVEAEKTWFLNQCGILGAEMDDDVMDQQKFASAAMVLARALVEKQKELDTTYDEKQGHILPQIPLYIARQIMTRADFIKQYDHENIFTIDSKAMVRADSVPMMNAFQQICSEEGFDEYLEATLDRIAAIESLNRTKELTMKDLWIEQKGEQRGKYSFITRDHKGRETGSMDFVVRPNESPEDKKED
ncbi:uncharacterized protein HMPREF1541_07703 [Cyphellophora europaea CBS 101466]|uniref:Orc1-like AAA ATPase domain-containing protein n=1 Tax=Cyphellophora europaea (strain CBS 101466) TaxID=1220924 RepID=W2RQT1_CYPE1|nr:uncharacterized protein HMPREF1541_07703 [Cyphellophora europaea CBS 101466]ETN38079.1 hypothetical protein HMPREF1541_07703 [Cyphellophora europaea CBS 101466]